MSVSRLNQFLGRKTMSANGWSDKKKGETMKEVAFIGAANVKQQCQLMLKKTRAIGVLSARVELINGLKDEFKRAIVEKPETTVHDLTDKYFQEPLFGVVLDKLIMSREDISKLAVNAGGKS